MRRTRFEFTPIVINVNVISRIVAVQKNKYYEQKWLREVSSKQIFYCDRLCSEQIFYCYRLTEREMLWIICTSTRVFFIIEIPQNANDIIQSDIVVVFDNRSGHRL